MGGRGKRNTYLKVGEDLVGWRGRAPKSGALLRKDLQQLVGPPFIGSAHELAASFVLGLLVGRVLHTVRSIGQ